jgi:subtilase family serine protease
MPFYYTQVTFPYILCWDNLNPYCNGGAGHPPAQARHILTAASRSGDLVMLRICVCSFSKLVVFAALLAATASGQTRNRIMQRIEDTEPVMVSAPHPLARAEFDQGRVEGSMPISRASMVFKLAPAQQAALETLLAEQRNPLSPNFRKWLTPEQYAARFGMSDADLSKVSAWMKSQGLTVNGFSRARTRVFFSGTASQVESVFHTEFHRYRVDGDTRFANATELYAPQALSGMLLGFRGLENFRPQPRARVAVKPNFTSHVSGNHFVTPADFATIYNLKSLYDLGLDGTGEKIAVVGQTQIHTADIDAFRSAAGLPATNLQLVPIDSSTGFKSGDEVESDLDVEWSGGVAKNATVLFVYAGASSATKNVFDALQFAIDQNLAPVISTSYGNCEANLTSFTQTLRADVQQGNSQGQTVTAAAGDAGATDCESQTAKAATHGPAVDAPASIPEVTAMGGSEFTADSPTNTSGTVLTDAPADPPYWAGTTNSTDAVSSALTYIPETAWNDTTLSLANGGGLSATGGGASAVFAKPSWQVALTPADSHRDVPDVSLTASPNHDGSLICSQAAVGSSVTSCVSGFRDSTGNLSPVGGTSVGSPVFGGMVAILNQATQSGGLGNINPTLYTLATSTPNAFHDITTGNNIVPCTAGSTGCPASHTIGFSAATGYDLVTGLGSVNANVLVTSWPGFVSAPGFSVGGTPITVVGGQSGTSTITVTPTNGFTGTVDLTCSGLPAGATCTFAPPSLATGTSTLTIATTTATPIATSTVTVTGTSGAVSHNTPVSLTVSTPPTPDFTVTAGALSAATVAKGGSATSTITVGSMAGFNGTVTLACSVTGGGTPAPKCTLAPSSIANSSGTSTLTISTTAAHVVSGAVISPQPGVGFGWLVVSGSALFAGIFFLGAPSGRRRMAGLGLMLLVFLAAGVGCGGGSSSSGNTQTGGTPAGSYTITVTGTSGSMTPHTAAVTLTVQ